ncbi:hypothetical protein GCM10009304_04520 [Pseudomonas matsuisoli]|uniref:Uncharacterized protein n=1 Tax=Pseudomonas matsuisoli TaxID=1515666 RepID=A0A917USF4_9PSED|nr:hypothetical protein GCM10009304_04520 [Pseudomonas matsuisoli]
MPLFKLPFDENRPINCPFEGQPQPAEDTVTFWTGVLAGALTVGLGAGAGAGVLDAPDVMGGGVGRATTTGVLLTAGRTVRGAVATVLAPLPKRIVCPG